MTPAELDMTPAELERLKLSKFEDYDLCLLCGGSPDYIGLMIPKQPQKYGAPKGKTRVFRYAVCENCADEKTGERVEKIIEEGLKNGGVGCRVL